MMLNVKNLKLIFVTAISIFTYVVLFTPYTKNIELFWIFILCKDTFYSMFIHTTQILLALSTTLLRLPGPVYNLPYKNNPYL